MAETHIDNASAGFTSQGAEKTSGKSLLHRFALCFHRLILFPVIYIVAFASFYYDLFTEPNSIWFIVIACVLTGGMHICLIFLLKMTSGDKIARILREILGKE